MPEESPSPPPEERHAEHASVKPSASAGKILMKADVFET